MRATALAALGLVGCAPKTAEQTSEKSTGLASTGPVSPEGFEEIAPLVKPDLSDLEMMKERMTLEDLNEIRLEQIEACEDYVCDDGTVIPKIWVQVRETVDGIGYGCGAQNFTDAKSFEGWKMLCNNDEDLAAIYVYAPIGKRFNALDASVATGLTEERCAEALKQLAYNGMLFHVNIAGMDFYSHQRLAHGVTESSMNMYPVEGFIPAYGYGMKGADREQMPYPAYYPLPVNKDIVLDESIIPYDDIEGLLDRHNKFCVSPCQCVYLQGTDPNVPDIHDRDAIKNYVLPDGVHLEKCYTFGEEAQFYIDQGIGREVSRDEMREMLQRSIDEGCVMQSCFTKYTEVICSCNSLGCLPSMHPSAVVDNHNTNYYANLSHYNLMYKKDNCIKCGTCVERCPMDAIEMDEDGYPSIAGVCVRCGQCAYVCPNGVRKLKAKDEAEMPAMPEDLLEWGNIDAVYRYGKGMWPKTEEK